MWEKQENNKLYPYIIDTYVLYQYRPDGYKYELFYLYEQFKKKWNFDKDVWELQEEKEYAVFCVLRANSMEVFNTIEAAQNHVNNELEQFAKYINETLFQVKRNPLNIKK